MCLPGTVFAGTSQKCNSCFCASEVYADYCTVTAASAGGQDVEIWVLWCANASGVMITDILTPRDT